uniref:Uncharacterized protein n=1 Tax=Panagrolaimus sp. PS1159 TaxID=55785 RepID=A0AC35FTW1_9BILA
MPRISLKRQRLKAAANARQARHKQNATKAVKVEAESSAFSNLEIKQEPTESPPSTSQILHQSAAVKVLKPKKKKKIKVEVYSEFSPPTSSNVGYSLVQKKLEKLKIRKAANAKRIKKCQEIRAKRALNKIIQQNEGGGEEEAVYHQTTVAPPAPPNPALEEINFYRQVPSTDYFNGYNSSGKNNALLIVYQPNDKTFAREYYRMNQFWTCSGCRPFNKKVYIRINNKEVFAPLKHYCRPRKIEEILQEQTEYQNISIFGDPCNLERNAAFYSSSAKFDKFDSTEYKFGLNSIKRLNSRLIVSKKKNPEYVYHYHKHLKRWVCSGCFKITGSYDAFGEFVNNDLYLPKEHVCDPLTAEESEKEQQNLASTSVDDSKVETLFDEQKYNLRRLYKNDFEFGVSKSKKPIIIVCEQSNRRLVREFSLKSPSIWHCNRCLRNRKTDTFIIKKDGNFYISLKHKCQAMKYSESMFKQTALLNPGLKRTTIQLLAAKIGDEMPLPKDKEVPSKASSSAAATANNSKRRFGASLISPKKYTPVSELAAKIPRLSKTSNRVRNTVIKKFAPKKQSFPVKLPPSFPKFKILNSVVPTKPALPQQPIEPCSSNQLSSIPNPSTIISFSPFYFGGINESTDYGNNLPSSSVSPIYDLSNNLPSSSISPIYDLSSNVSSNNDTTVSPDFVKNEVQIKVENVFSSKMDEIGIKNLQSVSPAPLHFVNSVETSGTQSSLTLMDASSSSSPTLPLENDKTFANQSTNNNDKFNQTDEIMEHDDLLQPKPSSSEIDVKCVFKFEPPNDAFIRSTLEKLNIPFIRKAFHFWAEVLFSEISPALTPDSTFDISSSDESFFKCLSCFFTENMNGVNFSKLDITSPEFQKLYYCNELSSIHYNFICAWLNCRIGIFSNDDIFERFGNWENEENNPILLIENNNGFYKPILTLV